MAVQLPLNILSGITVFGSEYVRKCLLVPPKDINRDPRGDIGYHSLLKPGGKRPLSERY